MTYKILILDDELSMCQRLNNLLQKNLYDTQMVTSSKQAINILKENNFDVLLCDCQLKDTNDIELLKKIQRLAPGIIIIYISDQEDICKAVELMKNGAYYYLLKPINTENLLTLITTAIFVKNDKLSLNKTHLQEKNILDEDLYVEGKSQSALQLHNDILLVAPTDYSIIIQGETGTGKESVARQIHQFSPRCDKAFVAVDCGMLSRELAASELFGYVKGAFTGAIQSKLGAFEIASGGTIFLDEIGNLAYDVQLFLLRAIQEKMIRKVGSMEEQKVDVRIIVASNENLAKSVLRKEFRMDLYYRLNEFTLTTPALRERGNDIKQLINQFIKQASTKLNKAIKGITPEAMEVLNTYHWPGNIRELKNAIKRACLVCKGMYIDEKSLPTEILASFYKIISLGSNNITGASKNQVHNSNGILINI